MACSVADTFADPHVQARGAIVPTEYPVAGAVRMGAIRSGAPRLGEHNAEVQGGLLGLDEEDLAALAREGVLERRWGGARRSHAR